MAGVASSLPTTARINQPIRATTEPWFVKAILIGIVLVFFTLFLFLPLVVIFQEAFSNGVAVFSRPSATNTRSTRSG